MSRCRTGRILRPCLQAHAPTSWSDHAKSRSRIKRNAGEPDLLQPRSFDVVALDDALESLCNSNPGLRQVIELHYFGGFTYEQIAEAAGASTATVHRDIRLARAWLLKEMRFERTVIDSRARWQKSNHCSRSRGFRAGRARGASGKLLSGR